MKTKEPKLKKEKKGVDTIALAPYVVGIILIAIWEILPRLFNLPITVLPPFSLVVSETVKNFTVNIWSHMLVTLRTLLLGLVLGVPIGIFLAIIFSQFKFTFHGIAPIALLFVLTPMITIVPLFMLWMGFDYEPRFLVVLAQSVPMILLNTLNGFGDTPRKYLEVMHGYGASKIQTFTKVIFPNALPQVFAGIKLGGIFSTTAAISVEMVAGQPGMGYRIQYFSSQVQTPLVFGSIIIVAAIGITIFSVINAIEKRVITWRK